MFLSLGIDGGDLELFKKLPMPFVHSLIEKNESIEIKEDLVDRGWAKIVSGRKAVENKSFYIMPVLDGSTSFTLSYSFAELSKNEDHKLLWDCPKDRHKKVGIKADAIQIDKMS